MRSMIKRRARDTFAVIALGCLLLGCYVSAWALVPMTVFAVAAVLIDPETASQRAREYRRQQRAADMRQQASGPGPAIVVKIQGRPLDCGCVDIPKQLVLCPADKLLAEIAHMAQGHGS